MLQGCPLVSETGAWNTTWMEQCNWIMSDIFSNTHLSNNTHTSLLHFTNLYTPIYYVLHTLAYNIAYIIFYDT